MTSVAVLDEMKAAAVAAMSSSYSPYSQFKVGACIRATDGRLFSGCNVENVSFGLCICAERTAAVKAVSEGAREFSDLVVVCDLRDAPGFPCGACRQFLVEFGDFALHAITPDLVHCRSTTTMQLLPDAFTPNKLPKPSQHKPSA